MSDERREDHVRVKVIGVLGAGQMGGGIAQVAAQAGYDVKLADASRELAEKGRAKIENILQKQVDKGKISSDILMGVVNRDRARREPGRLRPSRDSVIEAATENTDLKIKLMRMCDEAMKPGAILASNTSSIPLTKLAGAVKRPDLVIGMHFMNPPPLMKLIELVRAVQTSNDTFDVIKNVAMKMGKTVISSKDVPGFIVNRMLDPDARRGVLRPSGGARHSGGHRHRREARPEPPHGAARARRISSGSTRCSSSAKCSTASWATTSTAPRRFSRPCRGRLVRARRPGAASTSTTTRGTRPGGASDGRRNQQHDPRRQGWRGRDHHAQPSRQAERHQRRADERARTYAAFRRVSAARRRAPAATRARHFDRQTEDVSALRTLQDPDASAQSQHRKPSQGRSEFWQRLEAHDEEFATDLSQAILIAHMDMIIDGSEFPRNPQSAGLFRERSGRQSFLTEGWQTRALEHFKAEYPEALLLFYINHLGCELGGEPQAFLPAA